MHINLDDLDEVWAMALDRLLAQKKRVVRAYNKRVKEKRFAIGDLVWKTNLPINQQDLEFGKWAPNWPYLVIETLNGNAYRLMDIDGNEFARAINGKYLKKYYPSVWEMQQ